MGRVAKLYLLCNSNNLGDFFPLSPLSMIKANCFFTFFSEKFAKILENDEKAIETSPLLVGLVYHMLYFLLACCLFVLLCCCFLYFVLLACTACLDNLLHVCLYCLLVLLFGQLAACLDNLVVCLGSLLHFSCLDSLLIFFLFVNQEE